MNVGRVLRVIRKVLIVIRIGWDSYLVLEQVSIGYYCIYGIV